MTHVDPPSSRVSSPTLSVSVPPSVCACTQSTSQGALVEQQQARLSDLEGSVRQWESRCADLRDLVSGHEARCKEAAAEVLKGNDVIDKLQVRVVCLCRVRVAVQCSSCGPDELRLGCAVRGGLES